MDDFRVIYKKMLIQASLPPFLAIVIIIVWSLILKIRGQMQHLETRFISTLVILVFLVHPTVTQVMIDMFDC